MASDNKGEAANLEELHGGDLRHRQAEMRNDPDAIREIFQRGE